MRHFQSLSLALIFSLASAPAALSHDQWSNGGKVPDWVKQSCCGPADAHHLTPDQVHDMGTYYIVDGYHRKIPHDQVLPSQDGDYWIFYNNYSTYGQSAVYCFFVPMDF